MQTEKLLKHIVGQNIDDAVNLDLRGYGISRILYSAARSRCKSPLCMNAAEQLKQKLESGGYVFILTGFVFLPHEKGELDGLTGSAMVARALIKAWGAKPVFVCEEKIVSAMKNVLRAAGIQPYDTIEEIEELPVAAAVLGFSSDPERAAQQTTELVSHKTPDVILSIEKPGRNWRGVYHMGGGTDVSYLAAKVDDLFLAYQHKRVPTVAIGDLGNEIGLGSIENEIRAYIPFGDQCQCKCGGGICVETCADHLITASTSDWGSYGLTAAIAFLEEDIDIMPDSALVKKVLECANQNDLIDGSGWVIPSIDGIGLEYNMLLIDVLRNCISYPIKTKEKYKQNFEQVIKQGSYKKLL
ncbi:MAG TPA: DUF4392 domain-containing protein [Firmicutes bacterium]|nr:DUF4392 domain-containing protein [Bacillota bacterium]